MKPLAAEEPSQPISQLSAQRLVSSKHISSASRAPPIALVVVQRGTAVQQQYPAAPDRKWGTRSECKLSKLFERVHYLPASGGTECATSLRSPWRLSFCPTSRCGSACLME